MEKYNETLQWLFSKLPMYQRKGSIAYRPGLDAMHKLDKHLKHPHREFKSIHIGGTNGKGSTAHIIASVLQEAGFKTGLYSSPHLLDFRERIKIDGSMISKKDVVEFVSKNKTFFEKNKFSFFEMTVGMAFWYFSKKKVDYAVIEVGLGGRLDATNIITPELSIITNIGLDHVEFLGDNHTAIAKEKAGIIKNKIPVVIGEKKCSTQKIFQEKENKREEVKNLNTTLLLDPSNEDATLRLMDIAVEKSNYSEVKELSEKFVKICKNLCKENDRILKSLKDLEPKNDS